VACALRGLDGSGDPRIRPTKQSKDIAAIAMWNATVEPQLPSTMTVEVAYVGKYGHARVRRYGPNIPHQRSIVVLAESPRDSGVVAGKIHLSRLHGPGSRTTRARFVTLIVLARGHGELLWLDASSNYNELQTKPKNDFPRRDFNSFEYTWSARDL